MQIRPVKETNPHDVQCPRSRRIECMLQGRVHKAAQEKEGYNSDLDGREGIRNALHKLEGSATSPGQLERSIKRIPKHRIVRTHRFQEPPSAATRKKTKASVIRPLPQKKVNAPDLNTPRNGLSLRRAEVGVAFAPTMAIVVGRRSRRTTSQRANKVQYMHNDRSVKHVRLNTVRSGRINEVRNILQVL